MAGLVEQRSLMRRYLNYLPLIVFLSLVLLAGANLVTGDDVESTVYIAALGVIIALGGPRSD